MISNTSLPIAPAAPPTPPAEIPAAPSGGDPVFSPAERRIARALAEVVIPEGEALPAGGEGTVSRLDAFVRTSGPDIARSIRGGLWAAELATLATVGSRFSDLSREDRLATVERWSRSRWRPVRWVLKALLTPLKFAHFDDRSLFERAGCEFGRETPQAIEKQRFLQQVVDGRDVDEDLELECEVVVVGTGAGGAAVAHELAKRGRAVLLLEAGDYHDRRKFNGRSHHSFNHLYLARGMTVALGNVAAPVWAGQAVGGSTVINSGTCYRAPEWVFDRWAERYGLGMLSGRAMAPYYQSVETMLQVEEAPAAHLGGPARVVARGAGRLGYSHKPLRRNAPGCDGQGVCAFGCPTGAKRSTDVSYVPAALERGAQLVTAAQVLRVDTVAGRARGVSARLGSGARLRVQAEAVVVAGGALLTPLLLRRSEVGNHSGWLGRNLSIHPASRVMGLMNEDVDMSRGIPQSYTIDEFEREGLMFEGASTPYDVTAAAIPYVGRQFTRTIERYRNLAQFGFMIRDTSRGRVLPGPGGLPVIQYNLNRRDTAQMQRAIEILADVFLRAGARRVLPMVHGLSTRDGEIRSQDDLDTLRRARLKPGDFEVTAYHPLGTCRMGTDPSRSCVGPSGQLHDTAGLYVADGSIVPSSLGVNPQMTIMALALRIAEGLDQRLS